MVDGNFNAQVHYKFDFFFLIFIAKYEISLLNNFELEITSRYMCMRIHNVCIMRH